jgi:alpha-galactosidase
MNHLFTVLSVKDLDTGEELFDTALGKIMKETGEHTQLFRKLAEHFGILTYPSDDHIGEYMAYGSEFTGIKWPYGRECERVVPGVEDGPSRQLLKDLASGKKPVDENILVNSGELTVPVIADIELDRGSFRPAVNVLNTEGYISNLPRTAAVEIPATVDSEGIHPVSVGAIAEPFAEIIRRQCPIIELTTEAYDTGKRRPLLQALLLDPVVNSISEAETMLDYMLDLQKDYLPQLS